MAVITICEVKMEGLKDALKLAGSVEPAVMYGSKSKHDNFVLDYMKCGTDFGQWVRDEYVAAGYDTWESGKGVVHMNYTDAELDELCRCPVQFSKDGSTMSWVSYGSMDTNPMIAVSNVLSDKVLAFKSVTDHRLDFSEYVKDGQPCTKSGESIQDMIVGVKPRAIPGDKKKDRVYMAVDNTDKRFALVYADKDCVQERDVVNIDPLKKSRSMNLCVKDKNAMVRVYRHLADDTKVKEMMTWGELCERVAAAKQEFVENREKQRAARPLPEVVESVDEPESQMGE